LIKLDINSAIAFASHKYHSSIHCRHRILVFLAALITTCPTTAKSFSQHFVNMGHTHPLNYYLVYLPLAMTFNFISVRSGNSDVMPMHYGGRGEKEDWDCVVPYSEENYEKSSGWDDGLKRSGAEGKERTRRGGRANTRSELKSSEGKTRTT
jgi:hypothetical protein